MINRQAAKEKSKTLLRTRSLADYFGFALVLIARTASLAVVALLLVELGGLTVAGSITTLVSAIRYGLFGSTAGIATSLVQVSIVTVAVLILSYIATLSVDLFYRSGMIRSSLRINRGDKNVRIADIALAGDRLGRNITIGLWKTLFMLGWNLPSIVLYAIGGLMSASRNTTAKVFGVLFIIVAALWSIFITIVKKLQYYYAYHVSEDNRERIGLDCIRESKALTEGHITELFVTGLTFLGWNILSRVFIIEIFAVPYQYLTYASVYEQLTGKFRPYDPRKMEWLNGPIRDLSLSTEKEHSIVILSGEYSGSKFPLNDGEELKIGRDPKKANIVTTPSDTSISGLHCSIRYSAVNNRYIITDYSTNGTFVNNERIPRETSYTANSGTVVKLAEGAMLLRLN